MTFCKSTAAAVQPFLFLALVGSLVVACGETTPTPATSLNTQTRTAVPTGNQVYERFKDCIISSQLSQPAPAMEESKDLCLSQAITACSAGSIQSQLSRACEQDFRKQADSILKFGRQVECDSGACSIIF
jgi:hypothetical protein